LLVGADSEALSDTARVLSEEGFRTRTFGSLSAIFEVLFSDPPQCILFEYSVGDLESVVLLKELKADTFYGHTPVIALITEGDLECGIDWSQLLADEYIVRPFRVQELVSRTLLCLARTTREINANPLTGLPGNLVIVREAERRLAQGVPFAMCYVDINDFKAFNDKYGFARGDEVIRMTARILVNAVRAANSPEVSLGHIGGDDFVFITPPQLAEELSERVLKDFDRIVPDFYDEPDRKAGEIQSVDRQGNIQTFPFLSCSIAVVDTDQADIKHIGDLSTRIAQIKSFTKRLPGSNYLVDRRRQSG